VDKAPVDKNVAPAVSVLLPVVDPPQGIQVPRVLVPVFVARVGGLVVKLGVGLFFEVADLGSGGVQHTLDRR
jgi:hypothetical protein